MVTTARLRQRQPRVSSLQQRLQKQKKAPVVSTYQAEQTKAEQKVEELKTMLEA